MELTKKQSVQYTAKTLSGAEFTGVALREEVYDLIIDLDLYRRVLITPDNLDEFIYGTLIGSGIIKRHEDVISSRLCDANRFFIQLDPDLAVKVKNADGIKQYAQEMAVPNFSDIIPLKVTKHYPVMEIIDLAKRYESQIHFYAVNPHAEVVIHDCSGLYAIDKIIGGTPSDLIITNAHPSTEAIIRCYRGGISVAVFSGVPTSGAINFAQKTGVTLISKDLHGSYSIYADSRQQLVYR
ncbi:MAG: hypothetical protein LBV09_00920 [Deferribacteraceae bacterium]|jgi:formate dehydrogenase accessory protein FdhD|nr:hypothetical protein [Deferribacteraceae bacterium]